jgi:hypothetical protein
MIDKAATFTLTESELCVIIEEIKKNIDEIKEYLANHGKLTDTPLYQIQSSRLKDVTGALIKLNRVYDVLDSNGNYGDDDDALDIPDDIIISAVDRNPYYVDGPLKLL